MAITILNLHTLGKVRVTRTPEGTKASLTIHTGSFTTFISSCRKYNIADALTDLCQRVESEEKTLESIKLPEKE